MPADDRRVAVSCPNCGKTYSVKMELAGKTARCACGARIKITAAPSAMSSAPPPVKVAILTTPASANHGFTPAMPPVEEPVFDAEPMDVSDLLAGNDFNVRPFDEGELTASPDVGYELEAPPERKVSDVVRRAVAAGEREAARPVRRSSLRQSSWALKFVGVYGFIVMGLTALEAITNILGALYLVTRPQVGLEASAVIFVLVAVQTGIAWVIFRLGRGLVDGERSAVHGLVVFYVLHLALAALIFGANYGEHSNRVAIAFVAVSSLIYLPPLIVAYTHWDDFHAADD